jgi:hypothetical protein
MVKRIEKILKHKQGKRNRWSGEAKKITIYLEAYGATVKEAAAEGDVAVLGGCVVIGAIGVVVVIAGAATTGG